MDNNTGTLPTRQILKGHRERFNFIADIVEHVAPGVVNIQVADKSIDRFSLFIILLHYFLNCRLELFRFMHSGDFLFGHPMHHHMLSGSGFIVDEDGLIVTNAHLFSSISHIDNVVIKVHIHTRYALLNN